MIGVGLSAEVTILTTEEKAMHHVLFAGFAIAYGLAALSLLAGLLRAASAAASQVPEA